jgi:hypothetical protein
MESRVSMIRPGFLPDWDLEYIIALLCVNEVSIVIFLKLSEIGQANVASEIVVSDCDRRKIGVGQRQVRARLECECRVVVRHWLSLKWNRRARASAYLPTPCDRRKSLDGYQRWFGPNCIVLNTGGRGRFTMPHEILLERTYSHQHTKKAYYDLAHVSNVEAYNNSVAYLSRILQLPDRSVEPFWNTYI